MEKTSNCCLQSQARLPFPCWIRGENNFRSSNSVASARSLPGKASGCAIKPACSRSLLMATFISHSAAETEALGERWGRDAKSGLVIGLTGNLGAGKTQLVRGLARGLGI